jgi:mannosyltransferase
VISTHPEQVPVLFYYLPPGLDYATPLGPVADPRLMDWRDALARLELATPETELEPALDRVALGARVLLVRPLIGEGIQWDAPWTRLVRRRSAEWGSELARDRRFRRVAAYPRRYPKLLPRGVRAVLYAKTRVK